MSRIRRAFIDGPFGQVHIRTAGPETSEHLPLICLHQSPRSSREFIRFIEKASETRKIIAVDNPGHGESDLPPSETEATIENYARSAWSVIDAFGYKKADLLGHHTGTKVATEMAFQRNENVRRMVMVSALVLTDQEQADFKSQFQPLPMDEAGTRYSQMWANCLKYRGAGVSLQQLAEGFAENLRAGEAYEWGHQAAFNYNVHFAKRVQTLPHKITVLNPADMLFEHTPRVAPYLQNGEIIDHPEWEFGFMDVHTDAFVKAVETALN